MSASLTYQEIPLSSTPQTFSIMLNGTQFTLIFVYREVDALADPNGALGGGWCMDIETAAGLPILTNIPLVTGIDLMGQYAYLGLGFSLFVGTDFDPYAQPTFDNIGTASHLYYLLTP